jgi:signal transduction histidine kinase
MIGYQTIGWCGKFMNKIKGSFIVKMIAWVVLVVSTCMFLFSVVGIFWMESNGFFSEKYDDIRKNMHEDVSGQYSAIVMMNYQNGESDKTKEYFADKSFRYGIIEDKNWDDKKLNSAHIYLERNFTKTVNADDLYKLQWTLGDDTYIELVDNGLLGSYQYYMNRNGKTYYADRICYDTKGGVFYYRADGRYYPVDVVSIYVSATLPDGSTEDFVLDFTYDTDSGKYISNAKEMYEDVYYASNTISDYETAVIYEEIDTSVEASALQAESETTYEAGYSDDDGTQWLRIQYDDAAWSILNGNEKLTFDQLDNTGLSYDKWQSVQFSDVRELQGSELALIDSGKISKSLFVKDVETYLDSNYTLHVYEKETAYWVVSYVDEEVLTQEKLAFEESIAGKDFTGKLFTILTDREADKYVLYDVLLEMTYAQKDRIFTQMICMFVLALGSFVFLMCGAGHRRNREEIVLTFADKVPLDIAFAGMAVVITCALGMISVFAGSLSVVPAVYLSVFAGIIAFCVFIGFLLSFAVRIKNGKWWKNTILYRVFSLIRRLAGSMLHHIGLWAKVILIFGGWTLVELFFMIGMDDYDAAIGLFILGKMVEAAVLLVVTMQLYQLQVGSRKLAQGDFSQKINTGRMFWEFKKHGENLNSIGEGMTRAVNEKMKSERFKTELITNVSHDIKTPLTSIINYVDLLEKTEIQDETQREYLDVLKRQSARLKKLIEDLIEASKASTGNLPVNEEDLEADVFLTQIAGEFEEKLAASGLELILNKPEGTVHVSADGRHLWRVVDNLMNNICKYALPNSRVYVNLEETKDEVTMTFRNISRYPLNITSDELMERFVRGDSSRNTEGNGLGLSIAGSLMELMKGKLKLYVDGDLFKVVLEFPKIEE